MRSDKTRPMPRAKGRVSKARTNTADAAALISSFKTQREMNLVRTALVILDEAPRKRTAARRMYGECRDASTAHRGSALSPLFSPPADKKKKVIAGLLVRG